MPVVLAGEGADEIFGGYRRYQIDSLTSRIPSLLPASLIQFISAHRGSSRQARSMESILWGSRRGFQAHSSLLMGEYPSMIAAAPNPARTALGERINTWNALNPVFGSRALAYDRAIWLPNTYLEKTDRASMLSGLEVRVPFLDPLVVNSVRMQDLNDQNKAPLRELLAKLLPDRRLPSVKKGLSVDVPALVAGDFSHACLHELQESDSIISQLFGKSAQRSLSKSATKSPALAFRVAQLGIWENTGVLHK